MHVDLRRLYGLVSEPQRNDGSIHAVLKQFHRRAVAQNVWAYAFSNERGARLGSRQGVFSDDMFHGIATEPDASNCWEDWVVIRSCALLKPCFDCFDRVAAKRGTALLAPLAFATNMRARSEYHVAAIEIDQLRDAQARLQGEQQNRPISATDPRRLIGGGEQRLHLRPINEVHRPAHIALARHGEDALTVEHMLRLVHGHVAIERPDRGKARVPAAGAVTANLLDMGEEVADERGIEGPRSAAWWVVCCAAGSQNEATGGTYRDNPQRCWGWPVAGPSGDP